MLCPQCAKEVPPVSATCPACGFDFQAAQGDATGGVIPYKNPKALIAYYLGIFSGLPLIGFPMGIVAVILGILGLRDRAKNPVIKGSVHAGIGIGCGLIFTLFWGATIVAIIVGIVAGSQ